VRPTKTLSAGRIFSASGGRPYFGHAALDVGYSFWAWALLLAVPNKPSPP
jgi:hypothetical protein